MANLKVASAACMVPLQPRHQTGLEAEARDGFGPRFLAPPPVLFHFAFLRPIFPTGTASLAVSPSTLL